MTLIGVSVLISLAEKGEFSAKMVFNERGAIFFQTKMQHREQKTEGISYEDDYAGNALAAIVSAGEN